MKQLGNISSQSQKMYPVFDSTFSCKGLTFTATGSISDKK